MKPGPRVSRLRRNLLIAGVALVLFTIIGFFVLPPVIKSQLEKQLSAELGRKVTVGRVAVNPYAVSLTLENFDIRLKQGEGSFMVWKKLYVNFDPIASLTGDWVLGEITLDGFDVRVILLPDGTLNIADILAKLTAPSPTPSKIPAWLLRPVRVGSLKVNEARAEFADQSRPQPFATTLGPLTFTVTEFRTAGARGAPYHFKAVTESGEKLDWTGTLSAEPLASKGEMNLENIVLAKYAPYYANLMRTDVVEGMLSMGGRYEVNLTEGQQQLQLRDGRVRLRGLKLLERSNQEAVAVLPALDITGINADGQTQKARINAVSIAGGNLRLRRDADGSLNVIKMLQSEVSTSVKTTLPDVTISEVVVKDIALDVTDLAAPRPAQFGLGGLQLSLRDFSLAAGAVMPLQLSMNWAPQGSIKVGGSVSLMPEMKADLKVDVTTLALLPLSPYVEQFVNARLTQGTVTTAGAVQVSLPGTGPAITFDGEVTVENFGLVDGTHQEELAGFSALTLGVLKASTAPQLTVSLAELKVTAPYARVLVSKDGSINLLDALGISAPPASPPASAAAEPTVAAKSEPTAPAETVGETPRPEAQTAVEQAGGASVAKAEEDKKLPPAAESAPAPWPKVEIAQVVITDGEFSFADRSIEPNVRMALNKFNGTITGISSQDLGRGEAQFQALVDNVAPVAITGKINPLGNNLYVDARLDFKNIDLLPTSPYMGKYAGFELARGKLSLDITARVADRKVAMTNVITMNQFTFGAKVDSPDATKLPVRLGVALLKDTDGRIVIDVPVEGNLDDPNFRIGKVVMRVIVNLLTKAAVSPFSLLGSMFGGGGEELSLVEFLPGGTILAAGSEKKLETITKALTARPALNLDIMGDYDPAADGYVLKRKKQAQVFRRQIWEEKHARDPNIPPPDKLEISAEEYAAHLQRVYDEKFPPGTEFGAPLPPRPAVTPPPAPSSVGIFRRVIDAVTFKESREKSADKKAEAGAHEKYLEVTEAAKAAGLPFEEMAGRLAEAVELTPEDYRALADARAQFVRDHLSNTGKISLDRLFLTKSPAETATAATPAAATNGPRVTLNLQ